MIYHVAGSQDLTSERTNILNKVDEEGGVREDARTLGKGILSTDT